MALYTATGLSGSTLTNTAAWELRAGASSRARLLELWVVSNQTTQNDSGLGRPGAVGITPSGTITLVAVNPSDPASTVQTANNWVTFPTVPANYFRRMSTQASYVGGGYYLAFPRGLVIAASGSLVLWNLSASCERTITVLVDE